MSARKRVQFFATLRAPEFEPEDWKDVRAQLPNAWSDEDRDDFLRAGACACSLVKDRASTGPEAIARALDTIVRGCDGVLRALVALPGGIWNESDARAAEGTACGQAVAFPSDLANGARSTLEALRSNATGLRASIAVGKDVKPEMEARRYLVGRLADAFEHIGGGKPLASTPPAEFLCLVSAVAPFAGLKIGRTIVREVLKARNDTRCAD